MSSPRVLAVDSGAGHVACGVFASAKNGRLSLEQFALESFNPDAAIEAQWSELISQSLSSAGRRGGVSGPAVLSMPGHHTLTKFVKTPAVEKSKRDKVIQFEAQQNIPYPLNEVVWDYLTISDDGLDLEVMLAAVKLDVAEALCYSVREANVSAAAIVPSPLALYRSFKYNYPDVTGPSLVISIGARSTNLLFVDGNRFFIRTIALAGNSVTQAIADELKQEFSHAESLKLQVLGGQSDLPENSPARTAVVNAAHSFAGRLHLEITRSTVNYRRQNGAEQPGIILVTGGGSLVPDLIPTLAEKLKIQVERFDPLRNVEVSPSAALAGEYSAVLADLVGLAVQQVDKAVPAFSLLPPAIGREIAFRKQQPFFIGAAVLAVAALALPVVHFHQRATVAAENAQILEARLQPLRALKDADTRNLAKIETLKKEITAIQGLVESKSNWINFFTDLQERLVKVEDVWLEKLIVLRPAAGEQPSPNGAFGGNSPAVGDSESAPTAPVLRLNLSGRLLDKANPTSKVSQESLARVRSLLASFADSQFILSVEKETFNTNQPGILSFDFILVVDPKKPL